MGSTIVKCSPDEDFYVIWSSVVDGPTAWGTREEIAQHLFDWDDQKLRFPEPVRQEIDERLARTDENGTSAMWPRPGPRADMGWMDKDNILVYHPASPDWTGPSLIKRADLKAWCESNLEDSSFLWECPKE